MQLYSTLSKLTFRIILLFVDIEMFQRDIQQETNELLSEIGYSYGDGFRVIVVVKVKNRKPELFKWRYLHCHIG